MFITFPVGTLGIIVDVVTPPVRARKALVRSTSYGSGRVTRVTITTTRFVVVGGDRQGFSFRFLRRVRTGSLPGGSSRNLIVAVNNRDAVLGRRSGMSRRAALDAI
jgi:hypothetical protein